jgi:chromate reductase, NAD(P)H dehydrogenase (quinone)
LLRTAAAINLGKEGCHLHDHLARLPAFNPDDDRSPLDPEVQWLRESIHRSGAILFSTPEYAGALPGSFKNLLDWTIGDDQPGSIYEKPVGWVNTSPRGADGAYAELRTVLDYAHARIIDAACTWIPITPDMVTSEGLVEDEASRAALVNVIKALFGSCHPSS